MIECKTCGGVKPFDAFWKQKTKRGYFAECKMCARKRNQQWVESNRERYRKMNLEATHKKRKSSPLKQLVYCARHRAKKAGIDFDLNHEDLVVPEFCPILGIPLISAFGTGGRTGGRNNSPSLDRIDPNKGYTKDNVVVVSWRANRLKSNASLDEMRRLVDFYDRLASQKGGEAALS